MYHHHHHATIHPIAHFDPKIDAEKLQKAMKGIGCNKDKVIEVLCHRSNQQRQEIAHAFKVQFGKDLTKELKSELSGDFEDLILALMETPVNFEAHALHKAMAGIGTKENVLIELLTTKTNADIEALKHAYQHLYHKSLESDIKGDTSGPFQNLLVSLCQARRDESHHHDPLKANQDAWALNRAGEQKLGTDEAVFNKILATQNFSQLRLVFDEYEKVTKHTIEKAIESEFSGDIRDGLLGIVKSIRNRTAYFAEMLYNSMKGLGTRDSDLIRIIVSRAEVDLRDIAQVYHQRYEKSLEDAIKSECSGAYKEGLIALVKGNH